MLPIQTKLDRFLHGVSRLLSDQNLILDEEAYALYASTGGALSIPWILEHPSIQRIGLSMGKKDVVDLVASKANEMNIKISKDGEGIVRVNAFTDSRPDPERSVYIEGILRSMKADALRHIILKCLGGELGSTYLPSPKDINICLDFPYPGYAVVSLPNVEDVQKVISTLDCHNRIPVDEAQRRRGWRVMALTEFYGLKAQYITYRREKLMEKERAFSILQEDGSRVEEECGDTKQQAHRAEEEEEINDMMQCILHVTHLHPDTTRQVLLELLGKASKVAYVDYTRGDRECYVRYETKDAAEESLKYMKAHPVCQTNGKDTMGSEAVRAVDTPCIQVNHLTEEEEKSYALRLAEDKGGKRGKGRKRRRPLEGPAEGMRVPSTPLELIRTQAHHRVESQGTPIEGRMIHRVSWSMAPLIPLMMMVMKAGYIQPTHGATAPF
ncbi:hypothetical protein BJ684DRAFT_15675 [Piptocephalis cylindrospora]|uniref:XRRM domain-containing protein n=1 Tax=Piptocephalis cylindrospora TaxID=1907219 RepID=A0A4P9Y6X3_9FUNG|nr:hypothetical protein BJ684DRAFT_15675 [Piptocephalis cylindrospora]|eukprot:RKP13971.1 hypothetical protein BJ684DRAFT_15675 [Piptocephalis cylindrospora]